MTDATEIKNPRGDNGRFAGCATIADMRSRLRKGEWIRVATYGGGTQVEVRGVRANGRQTFAATAELK